MSDVKLKSLADRIERLMDERDGIQSDIRDIYTEAKSAGYVPKVLRKAITRKRMDPSKRDEEDAILDLYEGALSGKMRQAVAMAAKGASARDIEEATGIDHATVARSVALNKKSATKSETPEVQPAGTASGTGDVTTPQPAAVAITESCGGGERPGDVGLTADQQHGASRAERADPESAPAGVAPGPQDLIADIGNIPPHLDRRAHA